jgi:DNA repair protein RadC
MTAKLEKSMFTKRKRQTIDRALNIIASRFHRESLKATAPQAVKEYCQLQIGALEYEAFAVMFLDNKHRLIKFEQLFRGTIDCASVYPREVAKDALACNAAALIVTHNHPSGDTRPSAADKSLTQKLKSAMELLDIRLLDHIVVSQHETCSFAELGLL